MYRCFFSRSCSIVLGTPIPDIFWYKDSIPLPAEMTGLKVPRAGSTKSGTTELRIRKCRASDAGEYVCKARNVAGTATSSCRINVKGNALFYLLFFFLFFYKQISSIFLFHFPLKFLGNIPPKQKKEDGCLF